MSGRIQVEQTKLRHLNITLQGVEMMERYHKAKIDIGDFMTIQSGPVIGSSWSMFPEGATMPVPVYNMRVLVHEDVADRFVAILEGRE